MSSLLAREEPLLKQLVRSRACKRRDPISAGFGPQIRNTRSFSQPPPRQRDAAPQPATGNLTPPNRIPVSPGSPGTTYTLQFLPYSLVYQASTASSIIPVSLSQPDLRKCGVQPPPDLLGYFSPPALSSRCSSVSPVRCLSPLPSHLSPRNGSCYSSHAGTPARATSPAPSRPTTPTILINSEELYYAGSTEYYKQDFTRGSTFSQKLAAPNLNNQTTRDRVSPSKDDLRQPSIAANWERSLEVERTEGRKYSLTDSVLFPHQENIRDRSPIRDNSSRNCSKNNNNQRRHFRRDSAIESPCCCFNDLCCKVCLVFDKGDSNLTLEQMQTRAIQNIIKQKNLDNSINGTCACNDCRLQPSQIGQNFSPERSVVPAKKKMVKAPESIRYKVGETKRYLLNNFRTFSQGRTCSKITQNSFDFTKCRLHRI